MSHFLMFSVKASVFFLVFLSLVSIYSASCRQGILASYALVLRQAMWIGLGWIIILISRRFNYKRLRGYSVYLYVGLLFCLGLVLVFGETKLGAQRWLQLWAISFQPSELAKLVLVIVLADYYSHKTVNQVNVSPHSQGFFRGILWPFFILLVPFFLIFKQPDLGTALELFFIYLAIVFLSGVRIRWFLLLLLAVGIGVPVFWSFLKDYQKDRLMVFVNPNLDPLGAGYTVIQSKIAIGSGCLGGRGWLTGTQNQLNFLPERHTDFIFSVIGEEWGFFGSALVIAVYCIIIASAVRIALGCRDSFGAIIAWGIAIMLSFQVFVNISMTMGFLPVVGLPLPFLSYGGSSMLSNFLSIAMLLNIYSQRTVF